MSASLIPTVLAATGDAETTGGSLLRDELSLYAAPQRPDSGHLAEPEPGQLDQRVAALRRSMQPYTGRCWDTYGYVNSKIQNAVRRGNDAYVYLKDPPKDFYPRAGVIGFTGVLGLFLAKGSRGKSLLYPAGLMAVSTSLYYPERAAGIAKAAGDYFYERAVQGYAALEKMVVKPPLETGRDAAGNKP